MPRCGRSQLRKRDQKPSIVFTCTSQKPSPSSSGVLTPPMIHTLMAVSSGFQSSIDAIFIRANKRTRNNRLFDERLNGLSLHIRKQIDHDLTATLNHPKDGRPFFFQCTPATFAFESASTAFASLILHRFRIPFMAGHHVGFAALHLI